MTVSNVALHVLAHIRSVVSSSNEFQSFRSLEMFDDRDVVMILNDSQSQRDVVRDVDSILIDQTFVDLLALSQSQ